MISLCPGLTIISDMKLNECIFSVYLTDPTKKLKTSIFKFLVSNYVNYVNFKKNNLKREGKGNKIMKYQLPITNVHVRI